MFKSFSTRVRGIKIGLLEQQTLIGSTDQSPTVQSLVGSIKYQRNQYTSINC
jgi:hypothetical protein